MDDAGQGRADELTLEPVAAGPPKRRRALWGVLVATMTAAAALSVISSRDEGAGTARLPVALGAASRAEGAGAADAMLASVTYVPGDGLPALGGTARSYRLVGTVDEAAVRRLADALGLAGEPVRDGTTWRVAAQDGGLLEVSEGYGAMWWYSSSGGAVAEPGAAGGGAAGVESCVESSDDVVTDCAVRTTTTVVGGFETCAEVEGAEQCAAACATGIEPGFCAEPPPVCGSGGPADDTGCFPPDCAVSSDGSSTCPEPSVPLDLPSVDEARQIALDLLAATGMDVSDAVVRADGPFDAWYISVEPRVGGVPAAVQASVSVGPMGEVRDASGFLGAVEEVGEVPILDTRAAIDRANRQQDVPVPAIADGSYPAVGTGQSEPATGGGGAIGSPGEEPATEPACTDEDLAADRCGDQLVDPPATTVPCPPVATAGDDPAVGAPEAPDCIPPVPEPGPAPAPGPAPEPEPFEVVLVDAEPALLLLGANDGSTDAYLVPAYRFTAEDGSSVDLPAVADEALADPDPEVTSPPETPLHSPPCEVLVEEDESGTTHTVQPSPDCVSPDPVELPAGDEPLEGVGYYVDVQVLDGHCTWISVEVGGRWWWAEMPPGSLSEWSTPTEGGTFTLLDPETAEFVGDAQRTKTAILTPFGDGSERPLCD